MDRDSLGVMPAASRREVIAAVRGVLEVDGGDCRGLGSFGGAVCGTRWSELGGSSTPGAQASSATGFRASWRLSGHAAVDCLTTAAPGRHPRHINPRAVAHQVEPRQIRPIRPEACPLACPLARQTDNCRTVPY